MREVPLEALLCASRTHPSRQPPTPQHTEGQFPDQEYTLSGAICTPLLGHYSRTIPWVICWSWGEGASSYERGTPVVVALRLMEAPLQATLNPEPCTLNPEP